MFKLSIIIVNWNVKPLLERCLNSLGKYVKNIDYEIFVVDNCSQDGSREYLIQTKKENNRLNIILNKRNLGFSKANNQALALAKGEFILFLNPDTEFVEMGLEKLIKEMSKEKKWGIVGCQLIDLNNNPQYSVKSFPNVFSQILILLKLHYIFSFFPSVKKYFRNIKDFKNIQEVDQVDGTFMLIRKKYLDKIGSFDETFHIWFEDVDLCYRFKQAGKKIIYYPKFKILHHGAESFNQLFSFKRQKIYNRSLLIYFKKHYAKSKYWPLLMVYSFSLVLAQISEIFSIKQKDKIKKILKIK